MKTKVYIKEVVDLKDVIREAFESFGLQDLERRWAFVKPNMLRVAEPKECVTTDPLLVGATVGYLLEKSAEVVVGDNPIPQTVNEIEVARRCGLLQSSMGRFKNIGRYVKKIRLKHKNVKEIYISRDILDAEVMISLPKFKTHELTILSTAIKNQFGIIPGGLKPNLHYRCSSLEDFCQLLIEVYNIKRPDLIIVDALNIRDAKGRIFKPNIVVFSNDPWAVEYVCSLLGGLKPENNPILRIGLREKMFDPDQIMIHGSAESFKDFALPAGLFLRSIFAGFGSRVFAKLQEGRVPYIDHNICNRCRACENVCPAKAIFQFTIDNKKCIKCYCCFEVCPANAIKRKLKLL